MKILVTESQYFNIIEQLDSRMPFQPETFGFKQGKPETVKPSADKAMEFFKSVDPHTVLVIGEIVTAFIPYIGPFISAGLGVADAKLYYDEGNKTAASYAAVFALLPGILSVTFKIPGIRTLGQKGMAKLAEKLYLGNKPFTSLETQVAKEIGKESQLITSEVKEVIDLARKTVKPQKVARDYGIIKLSDNLKLITKPRFKDYVAQIKNLKNPEDFMDLKKGVDALGDYYYISTKMSNPIDAGKALRKLMEYIPKGARFGERATGSLSTDSFYNMLRRAKTFQPKVIGKIRMNSSGGKRFQDLIKNEVKSNKHPPILTFRKASDATPLINALNAEIQKAGINASAKVSKNAEGFWEVLIPNIELIVK